MGAHRYNFDGSGRAGIPIRSPWGLGVLGYGSGAVSTLALKPNGTRFGGWLLNSTDNVFTEVGDFDGDGRTEILVSSPWGIGILEMSRTDFHCPALAPNGSRFNGWLLNTGDNRMGPAGDFDGDGRDEWFVASPWGIGILEQRGNSFGCLALHPNGTRFGGWTLDTAVDRFGPIGDFDGDGVDELLVTSPTGIAILKLSGATFSALTVVTNGTRLGQWLLNTADNHFWTPADFSGGHGDDLLVTSPWGLGVLTWSEGRLQSSVMAANGTRFGGWLLNTLDNRFAPVGDLDGDGQPELLVVSPWGIGVLEVSGGSLACPWLAPNGTRFGGWLLNTADNYFDVVDDLDGDGRDEVVVTSPWGLGVLQFRGGSMNGLSLSPNGTRFPGGWLLNTGVDDIGMGQCLMRLHVKVLTTPTSVALDTMITQMQRVFELLGIRVQRVSTENLNLPLLDDLDIGACAGTATTEQATLFGNRNSAGPNDVVVYFVRSTIPSNNGCATHPANQPGAVVARIASPWTLAHELGHVLRLGHVDDPPPPDPDAPPALTDRLMTGRGTWNVTNPPPDVVATEAIAMRHSRLTHNI